MIIVNAHGPNRNAESFFTRLGELLNQLPGNRYLIVAGDFNSHLSSRNLTADEAVLIGRFAGHEQFNENGEQMRMFLNLYSMAVRSTQYNSNSGFRWTWSNGVSKSQVDHLLTHLHSKLYMRKICCVRPDAVSTDHKLLVCNIIETRTNPIAPSSQKNPVRKVGSRKNIDVSLLKNVEFQKRFQEHLEQQEVTITPQNSLEDHWRLLKEKLSGSATAVLTKTSSLPPDRVCRLAFAKVKKFTFWKNRSYNPKWTYRLAEAKEEYRKALRTFEEKEIGNFSSRPSPIPSRRTNQSYLYVP